MGENTEIVASEADDDLSEPRDESEYSHNDNSDRTALHLFHPQAAFVSSRHGNSPIQTLILA